MFSGAAGSRLRLPGILPISAAASCRRGGSASVFRYSGFYPRAKSLICLFPISEIVFPAGSSFRPTASLRMEIEFADDDLRRLEVDPKFNAGFAEAIVRRFRKAINFIRSCRDERDFRQMRSMNYEKLKGNRKHQHSVRINDQWRLIFTIKKAQPTNVIVVVAIEDYH